MRRRSLPVQQKLPNYKDQKERKAAR